MLGAVVVLGAEVVSDADVVLSEVGVVCEEVVTVMK